MKKRSFTLAIILALTAFTAVRSNFAADSDTKKDSTEATTRRGPGTPEQRLERMSKQLNLTDDQKAKLKPILADEAAKMKDLRADTSVSREDRRTKMADIRKDIDAKIKGVLTADQYTKWEEARKQQGGRRRQGQGAAQ